MTGRERFKSALLPVKEKKKILVVGGGPAGMTAAIYARMKGHDVTLYEKSNQLGGQLLLAQRPPGKEKIGWFLDYLLYQMEKEKIHVKLESPVTSEDIVQAEPDAVILSTGAAALIPDIPGIDGRQVHTSWDVLEGKVDIKDKVVLVAGGGTVGCETALYLAPDNEKVIIVEMLDDIALDMEPINRMDIISKIQELGIEVSADTKIVRMEPDGVIVSNQEKEENQIKSDLVVLAMGVVSINTLEKEIEGKIEEICLIGDSYKPRKIMDAVYEGFQAAIRL